MTIDTTFDKTFATAGNVHANLTITTSDSDADAFSMITASVNEALERGVKRLNISTAPGVMSVNATVIQVAGYTDKCTTSFTASFSTATDLMRSVAYYGQLDDNILVITRYDQASLNGEYDLNEAQEIIDLFITAFDATLTIVCSEKN